jgi:hypothetical protein
MTAATATAVATASSAAARHLTVVRPPMRAAAREEALSKARAARRQLEANSAGRFDYLRRTHD